jgi:hypothetical protein
VDVDPSGIAEYDNGYSIRCVRTDEEPTLLPIIRVSPSVYEFAKAGETKTFTITKINYNGSLAVAAVDNSTNSEASWLTISQNDNTLTVTATAATTYVRRATISLWPRGYSSSIGETVSVSQYAFGGGGADILYFGSGNRLSVGKWDNSTVKISNMVFTQFGSVVGFTPGGTYSSPPFSIKFNPMSSTPVDYTSIPNFTGTSTSTSVSSSSYHKGSNIKAGKGDICKLVGLTSEQAQGMTEAQLDSYNSGWRLPTNEENRMFGGVGPNETLVYPGCFTWTVNEYNTDNPSTATFQRNNNVTLPVTGYADPRYGSQSYETLRGYYWSSTAKNNGEGGHYFYFDDDWADPSDHYADNSYAYGYAVRCVK